MNIAEKISQSHLLSFNFSCSGKRVAGTPDHTNYRWTLV